MTFYPTGTTNPALVKPCVFNDICPPRYQDSDPTLLPKSNLANVLSWKPTKDGTGLFIVGKARTGKTRCIWLLIKRLVSEGFRVKAFDGIGWNLAVSRAFGDPSTTENWLDSLLQPDVLFIDDLFKGRITEAQELAVHGVFDRRGAYLKPIFCTTNTNAAILASRMTDAGADDRAGSIMGRITEFCKVIQF
jgi:DNA replication protein DnaC